MDHTLYRIGKRDGQVMTPERIAALRNELQSVGSNDVERLAAASKAVAGGWKSFYPVRKKSAAAEKKPAKSRNKFNNFEQRSYDYESLEAQLLGGGNSVKRTE